MQAITVSGDSITFGAGDSLDRGWCGRLKKYFESKGGHHYLYNLGICGNTTEDILERFDVEAKARVTFKREQDENVILFSVGINDSKILIEEKTNRMKIDAFSKNIKTLIDKAKSYTPKIAFIGLTPVEEDKTARTNERVKEFNDSIKEICQQNDVLFFDMFEEFSKLDYKKLLSDGLHPSPEGYQKMYELIKDFLIQNKMLD
jgi:lysophospholipase L1-like esterase